MLPYVPEHQGAVKVGVHHDRFAVNVATGYRTGMLDQAGSKDIPDSGYIPARVLVDVGGHYQLNEVLAAYMTASNVGNNQSVESWRPFGARPTAPRQLMVGLKGRFE